MRIIRKILQVCCGMAALILLLMFFSVPAAEYLELFVVIVTFVLAVLVLGPWWPKQENMDKWKLDLPTDNPRLAKHLLPIGLSPLFFWGAWSAYSGHQFGRSLGIIQRALGNEALAAISFFSGAFLVYTGVRGLLTKKSEPNMALNPDAQSGEPLKAALGVMDRLALAVYLVVPVAVFFTLGVGREGLHGPDPNAFKFFLPNYLVFAGPQLLWLVITRLIKFPRLIWHSVFLALTVALLSFDLLFECCVTGDTGMGWYIYYLPLTIVLVLGITGVYSSHRMKHLTTRSRQTP